VKCLLFGNIGDHQYHPLGPVAAELQTLSPEIGFTVSTSPDDLADPAKGGFDAVLNYADWIGRPFPDGAVRGLREFVKAGGGLVTVHNGIILNNRDYNEWTGAVFTDHPEYQELSFVPDAENHPVTRGLGSFRQKDEMYRFAFSGKNRPDVMLECYFQGIQYPAGWTTEHGDGRTVYLAPGHTAETFRHPVFRELLSRSLLWSVKKI
jgi:type 1 glutamine amidotransferase